MNKYISYHNKSKDNIFTLSKIFYPPEEKKIFVSQGIKLLEKKSLRHTYNEHKHIYIYINMKSHDTRKEILSEKLKWIILKCLLFLEMFFILLHFRSF